MSTYNKILHGKLEDVADMLSNWEGDLDVGFITAVLINSL